MKGVKLKNAEEMYLVRNGGRSGRSLLIDRLEAVLEPDRVHDLRQVGDTVLDGGGASDDGHMDGVRVRGWVGRCQSAGNEDKRDERKGNH